MPLKGDLTDESKKKCMIQKVWRVEKSPEAGGVLRAVCDCNLDSGPFFFPC